jgi:hypothetical protein
MNNDYETGWNRIDRLLINLINMIQLEQNVEEKEKYQKMIDKIINDQRTF